MLVLRLNDFYIELNRNSLSQRSSQEIVREEVVIDNSIVTWEHRQVINLIFENTVYINEVDLKCGLSFYKCEFKKGIVFNNVTVSKFDEKLFAKNSSIYFSECISSKIQILNDSSLYRSLWIDSSKIERLEIIGSIIGNGGLKVYNSEVETTIDINNSDLYSVSISDSTVNGKIKISSSVLTGISLIDSVFNDWLTFWNISVSSSGFICNRNKFEETFKIQASRLSGLFIHGDEFSKEIKIELDDSEVPDLGTKLKEIYITEAKFIDRFILEGSKKVIDKVTLPITSTFQGVLKFTNCTFLETNLSGVNEHIKLIFKNAIFKALKIEDFTNLSDVTFSNSGGTKDSSIDVIDSDLGGTKFNGFSFKSFSSIKFDNAFLNKIVCINTDWFEDNQLNFSDSINNTFEYNRNKREVYRQLKQALKSNGNQIEGIEFQAKELQSYRAELKGSGNYNLGNRLIMLVNRTNAYGTNWIRPFGIVMLVTLLFYFLFVVLLSENLLFKPSIKYDHIKITLTTFWDKKEMFYQLFNPARRFTTIFGNNVTNDSVYLFDAFHRLFLGVMIYQIIRAFRKLFIK